MMMKRRGYLLAIFAMGCVAEWLSPGFQWLIPWPVLIPMVDVYLYIARSYYWFEQNMWNMGFSHAVAGILFLVGWFAIWVIGIFVLDKLVCKRS
jgi:hypothetical protein